MTAPQPGTYRPPRYSYRPSQDPYGASLAPGAGQLQQHASTASETERIHRMLFSHYAAPHLSPSRDHGSNR